MKCFDDDTKLLPQAFYNRSPELVARELLGKVLVRRYEGEWLAGRVVETEAYLGASDPASHASRAISPFNAVLFGPPGYADVYLIYGLHYCLNVSCLPDGDPGAVLFRAIFPLQGAGTMAALRGLKASASVKSLTGGPARLCQAMGITRSSSHGVNMADATSDLRIVDDGYEVRRIVTTPRIGIKKAVDLPLRFLLDDSAA